MTLHIVVNLYAEMHPPEAGIMVAVTGLMKELYLVYQVYSI
jgi:hypothetical protein